MQQAVTFLYSITSNCFSESRRDAFLFQVSWILKPAHDLRTGTLNFDTQCSGYIFKDLFPQSTLSAAFLIKFLTLLQKRIRASKWFQQKNILCTYMICQAHRHSVKLYDLHFISLFYISSFYNGLNMYVGRSVSSPVTVFCLINWVSPDLSFSNNNLLLHVHVDAEVSIGVSNLQNFAVCGKQIYFDYHLHEPSLLLTLQKYTYNFN